MGILDFMQTPEGLGLVSGLAGYAANAKRGTPINNVGRGLAAGVMGYGSAKEQNAQLEQLKQMGAMRQMQMDQVKLANEQRLAQQQALSSAPEDIRNAVAMGVPIAEIWKRQNPERKLESIYDESGREQKGYTNPDGTFTPVGGARKDAAPWYVKQGANGSTMIDPAYAELEKTKASFARPPAQPMQPIPYIDKNGQTVWGTITDARGMPAANYNPAMQGAIAGAKAGATTRAESEAKKEITMEGIGGIISDARNILDAKKGPAPTASGIGTGVDMLGSVVGYSPKGADEAAKLKSLGGQLVMKMPRMEGPQSNLDQQLYREMAGDVGNPMKPISQRKAALDTIEKLNQKYSNQKPMEDPLGLRK